VLCYVGACLSVCLSDRWEKKLGSCLFAMFAPYRNATLKAQERKAPKISKSFGFCGRYARKQDIRTFLPNPDRFLPAPSPSRCTQSKPLGPPPTIPRTSTRTTLHSRCRRLYALPLGISTTIRLWKVAHVRQSRPLDSRRRLISSAVRASTWHTNPPCRINGRVGEV
jgi:hypothetical protein